VTTPRKRRPRAASARGRTTRRKPRPAPPVAAAAESPQAESPLDTFLEPPTEPTAAPAPTAEPPVPPSAMPELAFAARVPPPEPERPRPATRRVIFFDVENSSRMDHVATVLSQLRIDRGGRTTDLVAVGNWRVVSAETARLLATHGAQLVHSAPATGVRDWSDLRIAVSAGVWLAGARAGDTVEIITDDHAFDAVGDVATGLGVEFRRISYRALAGAHVEPTPEPAADARGSRRRRRGGRGRRGRHDTPAPAVAVEAPPATNGADVAADLEAHTAPHDALLGVARELIAASPEQSISLDALSNALKARGFRRTPGSPRLITRLRRIRELDVLRNGQIRLIGGGAADDAAPEPGTALAFVPAEPDHDDVETGEPAEAGEPDTGVAGEAPGTAPGRRRRRRRGGRGRRGRGAHAAAAAP
jgi:hypothetical protein